MIKYKRTLSLFICMLMLLSIFPIVPAYAHGVYGAWDYYYNSYDSIARKVLSEQKSQMDKFDSSGGSSYSLARGVDYSTTTFTYSTSQRRVSAWYASPYGPYLDYATKKSSYLNSSESIDFAKAKFSRSSRVYVAGGINDLADAKGVAEIFNGSYPILLNDNMSYFPYSLKSGISSLGVDTVVIMGGPSIFSDIAGIGDSYNVIRVGGEDRMETQALLKNMSSSVYYSSRPDYNKGNYTFEVNGYLSSAQTIENYLKNGDFDSAAKVLLKTDHGRKSNLEYGTPAVVIGCQDKFIKTYCVAPKVILFQYFGPRYFPPAPQPPAPSVSAYASANPNSVTFDNADIPVTINANAILSNPSSSIAYWTFSARLRGSSNWTTKRVYQSTKTPSTDFDLLIPRSNITSSPYYQYFDVRAEAYLMDGTIVSDTASARTTVSKPPKPKVPIPPVANLLAPDKGKVNRGIQIVNGSYDIDGFINKVEWSITPSTGTNLKSLANDGGILTFSSAGTYTLTVKVTDDDNLTATASKTIEILPLVPPSVSFDMPEKTGLNTSVGVVNTSSMGDGDIKTCNWTLSTTDGVTKNLGESGGTLSFAKPGTYTLKLDMTNTDGFSGSATKKIVVENLPPVVMFSMPSEIYQGNTFDIMNSSSDPDGKIVSYQWTVTPNSSALVGNLAGGSDIKDLYFDTEGIYSVDLKVTDEFGATSNLTKTIDVKPAIPIAKMQIDGDLKQNRLVKLYSVDSTSPVSRYPIDVSKTEWVITPLTAGVTNNDVKIDSSSPLDSRQVIFKKPGDYEVKLRVYNGKHYSDWTTKTITIAEDQKPIVNFRTDSVTFRDPDNSNKATIVLYDASYSLDADEIVRRTWRYKYDSNNDGNFGDEVWVAVGGTNDEKIVLTVEKLGNYLFELEAQEEFGQPTISQFVTADDRKKADTSTKPTSEKVIKVDNIAPYVDFSVAPKQKADVVFTIGKVDSSKTNDLNGKINTYIKSKLNSNNIDANITSIETSTITSQTSFPWTAYNLYKTGMGRGDGQFSASGNSYVYRGYGSEAPIDHLYYDDGTNGKREFTFDIDMTGYNACATVIPGFIFGANDKDGKFSGYIALMWHDQVGVYSFSGTDHYNLARNGAGQVAASRQPSSFGGTTITTVRTKSTSLQKSFKMVYKNNVLEIYDGGTLLTTVNCPQASGNGYGVAAINSSHGCGARSYIRFNNFQLTTGTEKTFDEVLKQPDWRPDASRYIINLSEGDLISSSGINDDKLATIISQLTSKDIDFIGLGTSSNRNQMDAVINGTGKGIFIDNSNIDDALSQTGEYILNKLKGLKKENVQYVLLGEDLEYKTFYNDFENDPEYKKQWKFAHNANYFENSLGVAAFSDQWVQNPITNFDKVGLFDVVFQAQDNPIGTDERFAEYRKWSALQPTPLKIYVHRKPVAQFKVTATPSGANYVTSISESSYDLDHISSQNKGIIKKEWKWKNSTDAEWTNGQLPSTLPVGNNYIVQLRVQDSDGPDGQGVWSDPAVQFITTKNINLAPVAQFEVSPNPLPISKTLTLTDNSYDPNGDTIAQRQWTVTKKGGSQVYQGATLPTSFASYGIGDYIITLKVQDSPKTGLPLWSDTYSQTLSVIPDNRKPVANFTVSPNPVPLDVSVNYADTSSDPDGDTIISREWQIMKSGTSTWIAINQPPTDFTAYGMGTHSIRLRVKDQPSLPQLDPLWSDWCTKAVTVTAGNQKPVARFTVSPNPVPADEPVTYTDTSYDPEGKVISARHWKVTCKETGREYEYFDQLPPTVFETTGWGANADGVGTYTIALKVKDTSPNGLSPAQWSDWTTQTLIVEDPLRITALKMTNIVNPPLGTAAPVSYPVTTPTRTKAGYKMTFSVNTNGGDKVDIKLYANGMPLTVHTDDGDTNTITKATVRKNNTTTFSFWTDKDLSKGTVIDMKIVLTKTKADGSTKSLVDSALGYRFGEIVGSCVEDSCINLTQ